MTINLKIEIVKVFKLEFELSSDKQTKLKKDNTGEESNTSKSTAATK